MTNETAHLEFPDINQAFIGKHDLNDVCTTYSKTLDSCKTLHTNQYSIKLLEFNKIDDDIALLDEEYQALKKFLRSWSKKHNVKIIIKVRKKSFLGFNEKILKYLLNGRNPSEIRDLIGFRLILRTGQIDTAKYQKLCYSLMNDLLKFFAMKRKCLLLNAEEKFDDHLDPSSDIAKKIFIHEKDEIYPEFKSFVKNYVLHPKSKGYQGLHACIQTKSNLIFEIQVRTFAMDVHAERIHRNYKEKEYSNAKISLDFNNIDIDGVDIDENGVVLSDYAGLFLSGDLLNLL